MADECKLVEFSNVAELDAKIREVLKDDVTDEAMNLLLKMIQKNIWELAYRFKNLYDKYLFDNMDTLQEDATKWYKITQYINNVMISAEGQSILAYVQEFIAKKNVSSNIYTMYYWNFKPNYNALSKQDKIVVLANELYRRLNGYFVLCEQLKRIEKVINDNKNV